MPPLTGVRVQGCQKATAEVAGSRLLPVVGVPVGVPVGTVMGVPVGVPVPVRAVGALAQPGIKSEDGRRLELNVWGLLVKLFVMSMSTSAIFPVT